MKPNLKLLHLVIPFLVLLLPRALQAIEDTSRQPTVTVDTLRAGVARVDITDYAAGPVNDPSYVKVLAISNGPTTAIIATVDAVAIGGIGRIGDMYLPNVRAELQKLGITPEHFIVNASHCHSVVRGDTDVLTIQAVKEALAAMVPVKVGTGRGHEDSIMENRRLKMKDGSEIDMRQAYSMPKDEDVESVGPVDPEIGILRLDRIDGTPLVLLYNFACHPIQRVPSGGNTADLVGFASKVIEENLGNNVMAFFVQGCAGDINPAMYKMVHQLHDAEPYGNKLGLSTLRAARQIEPTATSTLKVINEIIALPRGADLEIRIEAIKAEQAKIVQSLHGTNINLKTFLPLYMQHKVSEDFPAYYSQRYLHNKTLGRDDLGKLDAENRAGLEAYIQNIHAMEQLTRLQTNLNLLQMHLKQNQAAALSTVNVEICGVRIGDFVLVTFGGELTVEIGLAIKKRSPSPNTFVAGYTNGYIYYLPTEEQRNNSGYAQEDCDCIVAPEWQRLFDERVDSVLKRLANTN
ncbi:MAG TPA: hypothetical protein PLY87_14595 [Planctomycetaceae bacterium]|nr:hypothetical protein [Planctomycetaceae bacterium]HQZ66314.1 hypothetical protein [Planctomycetaceae bacterium]